MICPKCHRTFAPAQAWHQLCPACAAGRRAALLHCAAMRADGTPCRALVVTGEAFCAGHLRAGYGLFTLAVQQARREAV